MRSKLLILALGVCLSAPALPAAEPSDDEAIHEELRAVRAGLIEAYNEKDIDGLLSYCGEKIIVTWPNGEVSIGPEGIREYYERMMVGPDAIVANLRVEPTVDDLSVIYGGTTAVARGAMNDHYDLTSGVSFDLGSRWSATAVKEGDRWLIASFHSSANAFDNGLLSLILRQTMLWTGGAALVVGLAGGALVTWLVVRQRKTSS